MCDKQDKSLYSAESEPKKQTNEVCRNCKSNDDVQLQGSYQPVYFCAKCREKYPGAGNLIF